MRPGIEDSEHVQEIVATVPDWIWEVDARGHFVYSNPSVQSILGYTVSEILGRHLTEIVHPEDGPDVAMLFQEIFRARRSFHNVAKRAITKDGRSVWLESSGLPLLELTGELKGYRGIDRDVTERHLLQERQLRAEQLGTAGRVARRLAHDLNNLLATLVGYPDLIRLQLPDNHPAIAYCDAMLNAALEISALNASLAALGQRAQAGHDPVNLNRIVGEAVERLGALPATLELRLDLAADLLPVAGSASQLRQVASSLLTNAREAMRDRGILAVQTENLYVDEPIGELSRIAVGEYVRLEVSDSGPGIPGEIRGRIFEPFFTTKSTRRRCGAGLGLTLAQAIVEDHGGYIDLVSGRLGGTTFLVYLPVGREVLRESSGEGLDAGTETILVVDDDVEQREFAIQGLGALGYQVAAVVSGEEAIAYLRRRRVDLVVLDMVMPAGIDGAETYRRLRAICPDLRAIMVSGYPESDRTREAQALGAGVFLRKPLTLSRLAREIRRELDRRPTWTE